MSVLARIDGWAQSTVNVVMFAIMRVTGWGRSRIRNALAVRIIPVGAIFCGAVIPHVAFGAIVALIMMVPVLLSSSREKQEDEQAENRGLARKASPSRAVDLTCAVCESMLRGWVYAGFWFVYAFYEYSAATPPIPPPLRFPGLATEGAR